MANNNKIPQREFIFYALFSSIILGLSVYLIVVHIILGLSAIYRIIDPVILTIYFVSSAFSAVWLIFSIKKSIKARYLFFEFVLILLLLVVIEISLRAINFPYSTSFKYSRANYNRLKTLVSLKEQGLKAMPSLSAFQLRQFNEDYGIDLYFGDVGNSYIVGDEEDDGIIVFKSDSNGFRNELGLYEKSDTFDVFLLGDSFAVGCWVPDGFTIADYLKDEGLSVYNAGCNSAGLITPLGVFVEYGMKKKPKNVVLIYTEGDGLKRTLDELKNDTLRSYLETPKSCLKNSKDKQLEHIFQIECLKALMKQESKGNWKDNCKLFLSLREFRQMLLGDLQNPRASGGGNGPDTDFNDTAQKVFQHFQNLTNGNFLVVFMPNERFYFDKWDNYEYEMVAELCNKLNIPFIDMVKAFQPNPKDYFARNPYRTTIGGHCNRKGYKLVADEIIKQLLSKETAKGRTVGLKE